MRAASPALIAFLAAQRAARDAPMLMADCYTFALRSGTILTYTNADVAIVMNGTTFAANSVLVDGLTFKCATGLDVDEQRITLAARPTDTIGGVPVLVALARGVFDGCQVLRERAFLTSWGATPVGSVILFKGRMTSIDQIGRTSAEITVASDLCLLDIDMPRNLFSLTCVHALYDSGCGLTKSAYGTQGTAGTGATPATIPWAGAAAVHTQGTITFTSGGNNGVTATIKSVAAGTSLTLVIRSRPHRLSVTPSPRTKGATTGSQRARRSSPTKPTSAASRSSRRRRWRSRAHRHSFESALSVASW